MKKLGIALVVLLLAAGAAGGVYLYVQNNIETGIRGELESYAASQPDGGKFTFGNVSVSLIDDIAVLNAVELDVGDGNQIKIAQVTFPKIRGVDTNADVLPQLRSFDLSDVQITQGTKKKTEIKISAISGRDTNLLELLEREGGQGEKQKPDFRRVLSDLTAASLRLSDIDVSNPKARMTYKTASLTGLSKEGLSQAELTGISIKEDGTKTNINIDSVSVSETNFPMLVRKLNLLAGPDEKSARQFFSELKIGASSLAGWSATMRNDKTKIDSIKVAKLGGGNLGELTVKGFSGDFGGRNKSNFDLGQFTIKDTNIPGLALEASKQMRMNPKIGFEMLQRLTIGDLTVRDLKGGDRSGNGAFKILQISGMKDGIFDKMIFQEGQLDAGGQFKVGLKDLNYAITKRVEDFAAQGGYTITGLTFTPGPKADPQITEVFEQLKLKTVDLAIAAKMDWQTEKNIASMDQSIDIKDGAGFRLNLKMNGLPSLAEFRKLREGLLVSDPQDLSPDKFMPYFAKTGLDTIQLVHRII